VRSNLTWRRIFQYVGMCPIRSLFVLLRMIRFLGALRVSRFCRIIVRVCPMSNRNLNCKTDIKFFFSPYQKILFMRKEIGIKDCRLIRIRKIHFCLFIKLSTFVIMQTLRHNLMSFSSECTFSPETIRSIR
jgi:hypothetical protein